jgi:hypothetical protein
MERERTEHVQGRMEDTNEERKWDASARELFGVTGVTQEVSFLPNLWIKQQARAGDECRSADRGIPGRGAGVSGATKGGPVRTAEWAGCGWAKSNSEKDLRATERGTMATNS